MNALPLQGRKILVVEDEYLIALQVATTLGDAGAEVVGPIGTLRGALGVVAADESLDGAVLDVNLRGELVYPVADALAARGVPFVFATGYDQTVIPERFADATICDKPPILADLLAGLRFTRDHAGS